MGWIVGVIRIGWSSRDVSTDKALNMPGQFYMRIAKGSLDPLTVTCLALESGGEVALLVSGDFIDCRCHLLDEVRQLVSREKEEIPVEKILMNATHTHTGASHLNGIGSISITPGEAFPMDGIHIDSAEEYRHELARKIADCVIEAYENRAVGGFAYGYGFAVVGFQRRVAYFDDLSLRPNALNNSTHGVNGKVKMYGNTADDQFSHYEAGADPFVNLLFTFDENDTLTGAIINVPCPSQCSEKEEYYSADYWHQIRERIRAKYGNIFILSQCAAAGDMAPRQLHYKEAKSRRYRLKYGEVDTLAANKERFIDRLEIAERVGEAFDEVYSWAKNEIIRSAPLCHRVLNLSLPRRPIAQADYEQAKKGLEEALRTPFLTEGTPEERFQENSKMMSIRGRYRKIIHKYEEYEADPFLPMEAHVITLGPVAFASNQFELFQDFQHRLQARSPFIQTFVIQLAAQPERDNGSYLPTERAVEGRGFGASMYDNLVTPEAGQIIVNETISALLEMKEAQ